jgi:hypothetical protein
MRRRHYYLLGSVLAVTAYGTVLGVLWYSLSRAPEQVAAAAILLAPVLAVLLVVLLFPQYRRELGGAWLTTRRTLHHTRWSAWSGLSLVVLLLVVLAWTRSYWRMDEFTLPWGPSRLIEVTSICGALQIDNDVPLRDHGKSGVSWYVGYHPSRDEELSFGFAFLSERAASGAARILVEFPWWCPALIFAIAPILAIRRGYRRFKRDAANCCQNCGYDLTGNVSGVCPECGMKVERP